MLCPIAVEAGALGDTSAEDWAAGTELQARINDWGRRGSRASAWLGGHNGNEQEEEEEEGRRPLPLGPLAGLEEGEVDPTDVLFRGGRRPVHLLAPDEEEGLEGQLFRGRWNGELNGRRDLQDGGCSEDEERETGALFRNRRIQTGHAPLRHRNGSPEWSL